MDGHVGMSPPAVGSTRNIIAPPRLPGATENEGLDGTRIRHETTVLTESRDLHGRRDILHGPDTPDARGCPRSRRWRARWRGLVRRGSPRRSSSRRPPSRWRRPSSARQDAEERGGVAPTLLIFFRRVQSLVPRRPARVRAPEPQRPVARGRPSVPLPAVHLQDVPEPLLHRHRAGRGASRHRRQSFGEPKAEFTLRSKGTEWWNETEPIWVTASRADVRTKTYFWPGDEVVVNNRRPDVFFPYDSKTTFGRARAAATWMRDANAKIDPNTRRPSPSFMALYFEEPDHSGHAHGPYSAQVEAAVRRVDEALGRPSGRQWETDRGTIPTSSSSPTTAWRRSRRRAW